MKSTKPRPLENYKNILDDLLLDERGADTSSMSQDQETTKDRQLMLLPLSQGVDEQRLYNTIQRSIKLRR